MDGTVLVLAEGDDRAVEALLAWLRHGPPSARVTSVDPEWQTAVGDLAGFEVQ
jgi:acylphosphatase